MNEEDSKKKLEEEYEKELRPILKRKLLAKYLKRDLENSDQLPPPTEKKTP